MVSPPPPNPEIGYDDDEDTEYEEIEVEEEFEVEEEEEIEVEEEIDEEGAVESKDAGEGEIGEELPPLLEENQVIDMDLEETEEHLQSSSVTRGIPYSYPLINIPTTSEDFGYVKTFESSEKEELPVDGERASGHNDPKSLFCSSGKVNHAGKTPLVGKDYDVALLRNDFNAKDNTWETNQTATEALGDVRQMSPRSHVPQVRCRVHSSNAEFNRENKKMRIICKFHAKGWCIKGSSCRFLHIKDGLDAVVKKNEPLEREASSSGVVLPQQSEENPKSSCETDKLLIPKDDNLGVFPLDNSRGNFGHNLYKEKYLYPCGNFSSFVTSHDNHNLSRLSAFRNSVEEMISKEKDIVPTDLRPSDLPYSLSRRPLSFGSSSWNTSALGAHNLFKSGLDRHASISSSLKQHISPVHCSESESLLKNCVFKDMHSDIKSNNKLSSNYWEPSVPFRPSHPITRNLLMKEILYDPIRDIEKKSVKDGQVRISHSDQGSSIKNFNNVQSNSLTEEERLLDTLNNNKIKTLSSSCDNKLRFEEQRLHKMVVKADGSGKHWDNDVHMLNESKALKYFQAELIEFVKELVRPTWQEGLLSREAHKVIVKKAVDKVISTFQPQQIPSTDESIKSYLSSSRPKLANLVEAYIDKYGKS